MRSEPRSRVCAARPWLGAALAIVTAGAVVVAVRCDGSPGEPAAGSTPALGTPAVPRVEPPAARPSPPQPRPKPKPIRWRRSIAVGSQSAGRLVRGVQLPAQRPSFFTWDPVLRRSPNRPWRRWGTDRLVRVLLSVARAYHRAHPHAAPMAIGDLSRPRGGDFGPRFGYIGHASHQNGLDADVYYPRSDRRAVAPRDARDIDRARSQELVDRFLTAGAALIFVGPNTALRGPPGRVEPLANHDNHLHVRLP